MEAYPCDNRWQGWAVVFYDIWTCEQPTEAYAYV